MFDLEGILNEQLAIKENSQHRHLRRRESTAFVLLCHTANVKSMKEYESMFHPHSFPTKKKKIDYHSTTCYHISFESYFINLDWIFLIRLLNFDIKAPEIDKFYNWL